MIIRDITINPSIWISLLLCSSFVSEIPGPTRTYTLSLDEEDYNDQLGSAERDQEEEFFNSVFEKHRPLGFSTSETPGKGIHSSERNNHVSNNETSAADSRKSNVRLFVIAWVVVINHLTRNLEIWLTFVSILYSLTIRDMVFIKWISRSSDV